jgi:L-lactate dehydrogenase complex protein LldF
LSPQLTGIEDNASLPYASSLCGACYDVCPVKINIPEILVHLRAKHTETYAAEHRLPNAEASAMGATAWVMRDPKRWARALRSGRLGRMLGRKRGVIGDVPLPLAKQWTDARDFARPPRQTFRDWWTAEQGGER